MIIGNDANGRELCGIIIGNDANGRELCGTSVMMPMDGNYVV